MRKGLRDAGRIWKTYLRGKNIDVSIAPTGEFVDFDRSFPSLRSVLEKNNIPVNKNVDLLEELERSLKFIFLPLPNVEVTNGQKSRGKILISYGDSNLETWIMYQSKGMQGIPKIQQSRSNSIFLLSVQSKIHHQSHKDDNLKLQLLNFVGKGDLLFDFELGQIRSFELLNSFDARIVINKGELVCNPMPTTYKIESRLDR